MLVCHNIKSNKKCSIATLFQTGSTSPKEQEENSGRNKEQMNYLRLGCITSSAHLPHPGRAKRWCRPPVPPPASHTAKKNRHSGEICLSLGETLGWVSSAMQTHTHSLTCLYAQWRLWQRRVAAMFPICLSICSAVLAFGKDVVSYQDHVNTVLDLVQRFF